MTMARRPFEAARISLTGDRERNEDRCQVLVSGPTLLMSLADGLGGHPRGGAAAQLLTDVAEHLFRPSTTPIADPKRFMLRCVGKAHQDIIRFGRRHRPPIAPRTTAALAVVQDAVCHWVHVGDSRIYLIRDGRVFARTEDHTITLRSGFDANGQAIARSSLTRCLGGLPQPPTATCGPPIPLLPGDLLLMCSDGLWNQVPGHQLAGAFDDGRQPLDMQLARLANAARRTTPSDNVSGIALRWLGPAGTATSATAMPLRPTGIAVGQP